MLVVESSLILEATALVCNWGSPTSGKILLLTADDGVARAEPGGDRIGCARGVGNRDIDHPLRRTVRSWPALARAEY